MGSRTRDAANKAKRNTTIPVTLSSLGGSGSGSNDGWIENVLDDQDVVKSPPGSPTTGDRYIVPGGATGAWANKGGQIAEWSGSAWGFTSSFSEGDTTWVQRREHFATYTVFQGPGYYSNEKLFGQQNFIASWMTAAQLSYLENEFAGPVIATQNTPPASPAHGDAYIVGSVPTGSWAGVTPNTDCIATAIRNTTAAGAYTWIYRVPITGMLVWDLTNSRYLRYSGSAWVPFPLLSTLSDVNVTLGAGEDQKVITYNHGTTNFILTSKSAPGPIALDDLTDVTITAPADGQYIKRVAGVWVNAAAPGFPALDDVTDVTLTSPTAGQALISDGAGGWINGAPTIAAHNHTFDSLTSVNMTGKVSGSSIKWNGTTYIPYTPSLTGLSDVTITSPTAGQAMIYNGSGWVNGNPTASVPNGTGRVAALWAGAVGSGSWEYNILSATTGFDGSWPYYVVPAGYTKARVTTIFSNNVGASPTKGNSLGTGAVSVGVIVASGALTAGTNTNVVEKWYGGHAPSVSNSVEQRVSFTSHVFSVSTGRRLYPYKSDNTAPGVDTNPMHVCIELFT